MKRKTSLLMGLLVAMALGAMSPSLAFAEEGSVGTEAQQLSQDGSSADVSSDEDALAGEQPAVVSGASGGNTEIVRAGSAQQGLTQDQEELPEQAGGEADGSAAASGETNVSNDAPETEQGAVQEGEAAEDPTMPSEADAQTTEEDLDDASDAGQDGTPSLPNSAFAIETGVAYGVVVDVRGGSTQDKATIQLYRSNNSGAQRWRLEQGSAGYYIVNVASGKVLDVTGGKTASGTRVQLYTKNKTLAQMWEPVACENGGYILKSCLGCGLVLDVQSGKSANGTFLQVWTANGTNAQRFWLRVTDPGIEAGVQAVADGAYTIVSSTGSRVLDAKNGALAKGSNIQLYSTNGTNAQKFWATYADGFYTFSNTVSGLALDIASGSPVAGANVRLWTPNHSKAQQWSLVDNGDGTYRIVSRAGGLSLDVSGGKNANGANVQGYYQNGTDAQAWAFKATAALADGNYVISPSGTTRALDVCGGSASSGAKVQGYARNDSMAQRFHVKRLSDGSYEVRNISSGLWVRSGANGIEQSSKNASWTIGWLDGGLVFKSGDASISCTSGQCKLVEASKGTPFTFDRTSILQNGYYNIQSLLGTYLDIKGKSVLSASAVANSKSGASSQLWYVVSAGKDAYRIINIHSSFLLEPVSDAKTAGTNVQQATYTGNTRQVWNAVWSDEGGIVLVNRATGLALDISGASTRSGANVQEYTKNGTKAQCWRLVPVSNVGLSKLQQAVIKSAKNTPSTPAGYCSEWITRVFRNAGLGSWYGDACDMYWNYCKNGYLPAIQPGMIVAVSSHGHTWAGSIWGHIGIYIGDGLIMDSIGYVRTMSLQEWVDYYGNRVTPKWGWVGKKALV